MAEPLKTESCGPRIFRIRMEPDTQILCRVLGLFAQRSLLVTTLVLTGEQALHCLTLEVSAIDAEVAYTIAEKMRNLIDVYDVQLTTTSTESDVIYEAGPGQTASNC